MGYGALANPAYIPRCVDSDIDEALAVFGGVLIRGPKYCGKTWSGRNHADSEIALMPTEQNPAPLDIYASAPALALRGESPHLIDEWQELPVLWDMVRSAIDQSGKQRRFVLTGSSTPRSQKPKHSGVGRIERIDMRTMTLSESGESTCEVSLRNLFENPGPVAGVPRGVLPEEVALMVVRGGWPATVGVPSKNAQALPKSYVESFLEEDMHKVDDTRRDSAKMARLMRSLARNAEQAATPKTLIRDMTAEGAAPPLADETVADYMGVLERAFILERIGPWSPNARSPMRINKKPKYHYTDPSLVAAVLGASSESLLRDFETFGFLFECMCTRDLLVYAQAMGGKLFYYRDRDDLEIDAVVEAPDGAWGGLEIKLGHNQVDRAAANLARVRNKVVAAGGRPPSFLAVVEGLGTHAYTRDDGVHVVPIQTLCP